MTKKKLYNWFIGIVVGTCLILVYDFVMLASIQILSDAQGFYWLVLCCIGIFNGVYESFSGYFEVRRYMDEEGAEIRETLIDSEALSANLEVNFRARGGAAQESPCTPTAGPEARLPSSTGK